MKLEVVSRRTNFGERRKPAPDNRGVKLQLAGGRHKVTFRHRSLHQKPKLVKKIKKHNMGIVRQLQGSVRVQYEHNLGTV